MLSLFCTSHLLTNPIPLHDLFDLSSLPPGGGLWLGIEEEEEVQEEERGREEEEEGEEGLRKQQGEGGLE